MTSPTRAAVPPVKEQKEQRGSDDVNQSQPTVRWLSNKPIMMRQVWHQARNSSQSGAGLPATQLWKVQAWRPQLKCSSQAKWEDEASHNSFSYCLFYPCSLIQDHIAALHQRWPWTQAIKPLSWEGIEGRDCRVFWCTQDSDISRWLPYCFVSPVLWTLFHVFW